MIDAVDGADRVRGNYYAYRETFAVSKTAPVVMSRLEDPQAK